MYDINLILLLGAITTIFGSIFSRKFIKYVQKKYEYFEKINIPYFKPNFLVGNVPGLLTRSKSMVNYIVDFYDRMGDEKVYGLFDLLSPVFLIKDPEMIAKFAEDDFEHFGNHRSFIHSKTDNLFGNSLFYLQSKKWRKARTELDKFFTIEYIQKEFKFIVECAIQTKDYFLEKSEQTIRFNMKELFARYANDVIASCVYDEQLNSFEEPDNEFYTIGQQIGNVRGLKGVFKSTVIRLFPKVANRFNIQLADKPVRDFFLPKKNEGIPGLNPVETAAQGFISYVGGFDTTSTLLAFAAYEIACNSDVQEKLFHEIQMINNELKNGRLLDYDIVDQMLYMDMVVSEVLRLWPPVPVLERECTKTYHIYGKGKSKIKKGDIVWLPIYPLHRDEKYFPYPDKFDPDRFKLENKIKILPNTYLPFGIGPRICIGEKFALMEIKVILYYLLLNFSIEPNADIPIPMKLAKNPLVIGTEKPVMLTLRRRS